MMALGSPTIYLVETLKTWGRNCSRYLNLVTWKSQWIAIWQKQNFSMSPLTCFQKSYVHTKSQKIIHSISNRILIIHQPSWSSYLIWSLVVYQSHLLMNLNSTRWKQIMMQHSRKVALSKASSIPPTRSRIVDRGSGKLSGLIRPTTQVCWRILESLSCLSSTNTSHPTKGTTRCSIGRLSNLATVAHNVK